MSLKDENGKLYGWQKQCGHKKIKLHPELGAPIIEQQSLKLFHKLRIDIKEKVQDEKEMIGLLSLGPKKLFKMNLLTSDGWRRGFTK